MFGGHSHQRGDSVRDFGSWTSRELFRDQEGLPKTLRKVPESLIVGTTQTKMLVMRRPKSDIYRSARHIRHSWTWPLESPMTCTESRAWLKYPRSPSRRAATTDLVWRLIWRIFILGSTLSLASEGVRSARSAKAQGTFSKVALAATYVMEPAKCAGQSNYRARGRPSSSDAKSAKEWGSLDTKHVHIAEARKFK